MTKASQHRRPTRPPTTRTWIRDPADELTRSPVPPTSDPYDSGMTHAREVRGPRSTAPDGVRVVDGGRVVDLIGQVLDRAENHVYSVLTHLPSPAVLHASRDDDLALCRRGPSVQIVYPLEFAGRPHLREYAADLHAAGANISFVPERPPCRMLVVDGRTVVAPVDVHAEERGAVVTSAQGLGTSMLALARRIFASGVQLADEEQDTAPSPLEVLVLRALLTGDTDRAAAHRLGISDRTYRRYVASLTDKLGAGSRFQAGVLAAQRGWV